MNKDLVKIYATGSCFDSFIRTSDASLSFGILDSAAFYLCPGAGTSCEPPEQKDHKCWFGRRAE